MSRKMQFMFSILVVLSVLLTACGAAAPAATEAPAAPAAPAATTAPSAAKGAGNCEIKMGLLISYSKLTSSKLKITSSFMLYL